VPHLLQESDTVQKGACNKTVKLR